jgi:hypothetical protein
MKTQIYDKNYSFTNLTIDTDIYTNSKINGIAKMMMQLYRKMTKDGQIDIKNYTKMQAIKIFHTRVKDIEWNQEQLMKKGFITIYEDDVQGEMIKFHYTKRAVAHVTKTDNSLF